MNFVPKKKPNAPKNPQKKNIDDGGESSGRNMMKDLYEQSSGIGGRQPVKNVQRAEKRGAATTTTDSDDPWVILVITEGRHTASGEIGLASIDINAPTLILSQLSDDMWYSGTIVKIQLLNPMEIVVPNTYLTDNRPTNDSKMIRVIMQAFPDMQIRPTSRKGFSDTAAIELITELGLAQCQSVKLALEGKYYALAAAAGLFNYLKTSKCITFAPATLQIDYEAKYGAMMIDMETSKRLELVASLMPRKQKNSSLFHYLDRCCTQVGKRALRARILAPLCDRKQIQDCQAAVQELMHQEPTLNTLKIELKKFRNVDKMRKLCMVIQQTDAVRAAEIMIAHVLTFKSCLEAIPELLSHLHTLKHDTFKMICQGLEDERYAAILATINKYIVSDIRAETGARAHVQRIYAVKKDINVYLDISRRLYHALLEDLKKTVQKMSKDLNLTLDLGHNASKGYHVILSHDPKNRPPDLPTEYEVIQRRRGKVFFKTEDIIRLDQRIRHVLNEIMLISNQQIHTMLTIVRKDIECVYMLTAAILEIDLIQSFATIAAVNASVCPSFGHELHIIDGIHPFLEFGAGKIVPVPNNVCATSEYNFFIITGANMGGKTVYLKMVALLQVMAQLGAFIPASSGEFRICDKLFSRMGFEDTVQRGISNFEYEKLQIEYILTNLTANSVVVVDELGRSTNPDEGKIWAWGICEELANLQGESSDGRYFRQDCDNNCEQQIEETKLLNIVSPFIFFTTHFNELTKLPDHFFNIVNLHLDAEEVPSNEGDVTLKYTHKVKFGPTPLEKYGLSLAKLVKFPRSVLPRAEELYQQLEDGTASSGRADGPSQHLKNERSLYDLYAQFASVLRVENSEEPTEETKKQIELILKEFVDQADPQFLFDIMNKDASEVLDKSFTIKSPPVTSKRTVVTTDPKSIGKDLTAQLDSTPDDISSLLHGPVEDISSLLSLDSPPSVPKESSLTKAPVSIDFSRKTPFKPEHPSKHQNDALKSASRNSSTDSFIETSNIPSTIPKESNESEGQACLPNLIESDDIDLEFEKLFNTPIASTQETITWTKERDDEMNRFWQKERKDTDFFDFPPPRSVREDPWMSSFLNPASIAKEFSNPEPGPSKVLQTSVPALEQWNLPSCSKNNNEPRSFSLLQAEKTTSTSGTGSSEGLNRPKAKKDCIELYRERKLLEIKENNGRINYEPKKKQPRRKPLVTHISFDKMWIEQKHREMLQQVCPKVAPKPVDVIRTSTITSRDLEVTRSDSTSKLESSIDDLISQSDTRGDRRIAWFPDIGTLSSQQHVAPPNPPDRPKGPKKHEKMVATAEQLRKLREFQE
ncbi:mutS protein homolog 4 [Sergentomyia squamirostris]